MKDSSLGSFLQQLRKENQLTQKELASQLHVTDKAVSKWERDLSAPDISLLIPLAQILGVSTTELLQGRRMADPPQAETESSVAEALRYSDRQVRHRLRRLWAHALLLFSALCLLAAGICPAAQAHSCQSFFISPTPFDRAARIALAFSGRLC